MRKRFCPGCTTCVTPAGVGGAVVRVGAAQEDTMHARAKRTETGRTPCCPRRERRGTWRVRGGLPICVAAAFIEGNIRAWPKPVNDHVAVSCFCGVGPRRRALA